MGRGLQGSKGGFAVAQQCEEGSPGLGASGSRALRPHGPEY